MRVLPTHYLLDVADAAAVGGFVRECGAQSLPYRMGGEMFHVCGEVKQFVFIEGVRMHRLHREFSAGEGSGLVEDHGAELRQNVHIAAALHEYALAGSSSETSEEGERHADDQGAGAGDHEEDQRAVEPVGEGRGETAGREHGRNQRQQHRRDDHNGSVDAREAGYEGFAAGLVAVCALDEA